MIRALQKRLLKRRIWLLLIMIGGILPGVATAEPYIPPDIAPPPSAVSPLPACPSTEHLCQETTLPPAEDLRDAWRRAGAPVWLDDDILTLIYENGEATAVNLAGSVRAPMQAVPDSDLWVLRLRLSYAREAMLLYAFVPLQPEMPLVRLNQWRGPDSPPAPPLVSSLTGSLIQHDFESEALGESRPVTIYLPPGYDPAQTYPVIYMPDGKGVSFYVAVVEPLIVDGTIPPVLLVGTHAASDGNGRAVEYLPGFDAARYDAHEQFFTEEVRLWAEATLGASTQRTERAVFGASNGGVFAAALGVDHPDLYGASLIFSAGMHPPVPPQTARYPIRFYLMAGTMERGFYRRTITLGQRLRHYGGETLIAERVGGHDLFMWREELPSALRWLFRS